MQVTYVVLNFLTTLLKMQEETGEIYFNNIYIN